MKATTLLPLSLAILSLHLGVAHAEGAVLEKTVIQQIAQKHFGEKASDVVSQLPEQSRSNRENVRPFVGISESNG
jgi:hypothetical protein